MNPNLNHELTTNSSRELATGDQVASSNELVVHKSVAIPSLSDLARDLGALSGMTDVIVELEAEQKGDARSMKLRVRAYRRQEK